ncbi:hypothetical protein BJ742DRAFT_821513 [Cladochytrium replicatum]|nr:hypothetical protein BJ742DRAFT_821513 [Cladochytrium replicatum]
MDSYSASSSSPSFETQQSSDSSSDSLLPPRKRPGRKPATSDPNNKRAAQNRAAQRAFVQRKKNYIKELEAKIDRLEKEKRDALLSCRNTNHSTGPSESNAVVVSTRNDISASGRTAPAAETISLRSKVKFLEIENADLRSQLLQSQQAMRMAGSISTALTSSTTATPVSLPSPLPLSFTTIPLSLPSPPLSLPLTYTASPPPHQPRTISFAPPLLQPLDPLYNDTAAISLYPTLLSDLSAPLSTSHGFNPTYYDVPIPDPSPFTFAPFQPIVSSSTDPSPFHGFNTTDIISISVARSAVAHVQVMPKDEYIACEDPVMTAKGFELLLEDESALDEICVLFKARLFTPQIRWLHLAMTEACRMGDRVQFNVLVRTGQEQRRALEMSLKMHIPSLAPIVAL